MDIGPGTDQYGGAGQSIQEVFFKDVDEAVR